MPFPSFRVALVLAAACGAFNAAAAESAAPIAAIVPKAPAPVEVGGAKRLFWEVHLAKYQAGDMQLDDFQVRDADTGALLSDDKGDALAAMLTHPGANPAPKDARTLPGGQIAVIFVETTLPAGQPIPKTLKWTLTMSGRSRSDPTKILSASEDGSTEVGQGAPITVGFPFSGGTWMAVNGPSNTSGHRTSVQVINGRPKISQRLAIDWIKLGADGRPYRGPLTVNASWYDFGTPVLAVADGTVSDTHDGIPENTPPGRAVPITLETVGGNYIILDLGGGRFAFYAHLQPGSLKVRVGDHVARGEPLALLGNTGNSDAPHLHFHITDASSPLGAEGVPYVFQAYTSLGTANFDQLDAGGSWKATAAPVAVSEALPAENEVVEVPAIP